jgi:hypothetical protein
MEAMGVPNFAIIGEVEEDSVLTSLNERRAGVLEMRAWVDRSWLRHFGPRAFESRRYREEVAPVVGIEPLQRIEIWH